MQYVNNIKVVQTNKLANKNSSLVSHRSNIIYRCNKVTCNTTITYHVQSMVIHMRHYRLNSDNMVPLASHNAT